MWHFVVCDDEESCRREIVEKLRAVLAELQISDDTYDIAEYASLAQLQRELVEPDIGYCLQRGRRRNAGSNPTSPQMGKNAVDFCHIYGKLYTESF